MRGISLLIQELKAMVTNKKLIVPIIVLMFIPLLYSGMFLWAFWDPYDQMDRLPVAVVNQDIGTVYNDEELHIGDDLVDQLKDNEGFGWDFVDENVAQEGLDNLDYYMMVEIPVDFSERATTLLEDNPTKLELKYIPNESYNFLAGQIGESAIEKIKGELANEISATFAESLFDNVDELADGLTEASDGASKIDDGVTELNDGAITLQENLAKLASNTITFKEGLQASNNGSKELVDGVTALKDGFGEMKTGQEELLAGALEAQNGTEQLSNGLQQSLQGVETAQSSIPQLTDGSLQLNDGTQQLIGSIEQWKQAAEQTAAGSAQLSTGIEQLNEVIQPMFDSLPEEQKEQLKVTMASLIDGSKEVNGGLEQLTVAADEINGGATVLSTEMNKLHQGQLALQTGIIELAEGQQVLVDGATKLLDGQDQLVGGLQLFGEKITEAQVGTGNLLDGSNKLSAGIDELATGSLALEDGASQLADGSIDLIDGFGELSEGANELSTKLTDASTETSEISGNDDMYNMFADPVTVEEKKMNEVPNYGTGFAPYFLSLGLFVGALLLSIVFPLRETIAAPKNPFSWFISKFGVLVIVGIIQALIADAVLLYGLGLEVKSVPLFILFSILTSVTFITLIQFLVTCFNDPGRFLAIVILILQLTTSAGTFPLEVIPDVLQPFNTLLPMTYTVSGLKAVISSGDYGFMWQNATILLMFIVLMSLGTLLYFVMQFKRKYGANAAQS
ncbi:YhgE/Pip domain-containing protein [Cytobacillus sp. IB215665]|uniref:YhgE/Pip domain-containing protein n=1 Tax=Cytobacillus sp. IB215665 TaxID=3097357 RepID=UPI002A147FA2|nr:YhgE/Pip domain-containing protein [Cytobacillus sp. IB215665]MDX8364602.1 YhgE/Pip domain-containing protein [Cytobacillus sp. IB215665]